MSDKVKQAIETFTMLRDVACESGEPQKIMEAYELLGGILQRDKQYDRSIICFKKILLYAWYHNMKRWELLAFEKLAIQHFYLGEIKQADFYQERASRGIVEADTSQNKIMAIQLYLRQQKQRNKNNLSNPGQEFGLKGDQNISVTRDGGNVTVDLTCKSYGEILDYIKDLQTSTPEQLLSLYQQNMELVTDRMMAGRMIRAWTPISRLKRSDIPSPSRLHHDQLLLPYLSRNGEFVIKEPDHTLFADKKEIMRDENPYSLANMTLPEEPEPRRSKKMYKVKTLKELQAEKEERSLSQCRKQQKITMNRLKYQDGAKMFDYLQEFKAERAKYTQHKSTKFDMAVVLRKAKTRKNINTDTEKAYLTHMSMGYQLQAKSTKKGKNGGAKQNKKDQAARTMNLQERTGQSKAEAAKRRIISKLEVCLQTLGTMGEASFICRNMSLSKYRAITEQFYHGTEKGMRYGR